MSSKEKKYRSTFFKFSSKIFEIFGKPPILRYLKVLQNERFQKKLKAKIIT